LDDEINATFLPSLVQLKPAKARDSQGFPTFEFCNGMKRGVASL
jgi:hypothetical protein